MCLVSVCYSHTRFHGIPMCLVSVCYSRTRFHGIPMCLVSVCYSRTKFCGIPSLSDINAYVTPFNNVSYYFQMPGFVQESNFLAPFVAIVFLAMLFCPLHKLNNMDPKAQFGKKVVQNNADAPAPDMVNTTVSSHIYAQFWTVRNPCLHPRSF